MRTFGAAVLALAVVTFDTSLVEFLEIQRLSDDARRARFNLPASCDPRVNAVVRADRVRVLVDCAASSAAPQQAPVKAGWPKPDRGQEPGRG